MASIVIPYLRRKASGFYWEPSKKLRALGFFPETLGRDEAKAIARARILNDQVAAALTAPDTGPREGSMKWLVHQYERSTNYKKLRPVTREGYDAYLREILAMFGDVQVAAFTRRAIKAYQRGLEEKRGRANAAGLMRVLSILFSFAVDEGVIEHHPALRLRLAAPAERDQVWTREQIKSFCAKAIERGRPSMALSVLLSVWLGQRQGDVLIMPWSAYDSATGTISIRQKKTGRPVAIPVKAELADMLASAPRLSPTILINEETGRPYKDDNFKHLFRKLAEATGLPPDLQFRDLRRTTATWLGEAGCTDDEIRAVTGHTTRSVVARYVRPSDTMSRAAMSRLEKHQSGTATETDSGKRRKKDS